MQRSSKTDAAGARSADIDDPSAFLQLITTVALCGFVLQFVGLRGMHWSASVAQLGAVLVMVGVKAWVRRGLADSPAFEPLPSGFELDPFVKTLGEVGRQAWSGARSNKDNPSDKTPNWLTQSTNDWIIITGGESTLIPRKGTQQSSDSNDACRSTSSLASPEQTQPNFPSIKESINSDAQMVMGARKQLARLAIWRGHASEGAISLARAIECTMDNLNKCLPLGIQEFAWTLETLYIGAKPSLSAFFFGEESVDERLTQPTSKR